LCKTLHTCNHDAINSLSQCNNAYSTKDQRLHGQHLPIELPGHPTNAKTKRQLIFLHTGK
jgi:hypothetical protein